MKIRLPHTIERKEAERYALAIEVADGRFAFSLHAPDEREEWFRYCFPKEEDGFSQFREAFFEHAFFSYSFRKIKIVNRTAVFTCVPNLLFEEKDKQAYMRFAFSDGVETVLHQTLSEPEMTILHALPEEVYGFLLRSFPEACVVHHTAALIGWCQTKGQETDANRMFVFRRPEGMDVLCFSRRQLLLSNHFRCKSAEEVVYYALYVYKQLRFNQLKDPICLVEAEETLSGKLNHYVQNVVRYEDREWKIQTTAL
jgi:hypothetical protein